MAAGAPDPKDDPADVKPPPAATPVWRRLLDYALANPLKVSGGAAFSFGGVLLLAFFTDIGHLPALDLQGIASMLYAVSLIGLALLLCVAALLVAPGLMMRGLLEELWPAASGSVPTRNEMVLAGLPWLAAFIASASLVGWLLFSAVSLAWTVSSIGAACLAYLVLIARLWNGPVCATVRWYQLLPSILAAVALFSLPLSVILQFLLVGDLARADLGVAAAQLWALLAVCAVFAWMLCAARRPLPVGIVVVIALVLMVAMVLLTRSATATPHLIVRKLRLGDIEFASVAVTAAGCRQVNAALGANVCEPPREAGELAALCPVVIRSRMGAERLLEFGVPQWQERKTADGQRLVARWPADGLHRVVLNADAMPSWRPLKPELDPNGLPATTPPANADVQLWREADAGADTPLRRLCAVRLAPPTTAASAASR